MVIKAAGERAIGLQGWSGLSRRIHAVMYLLYRQIRLVMRTRSRIRTSAVWGAGDAGTAGLPAEPLLRRA